MSTDLLSFLDASQRGDTREIASHLFPPACTDTARKSYVTSQSQEHVPHAGLGSVEAGTSYPVTCRARYYDAASRILEEELGLFTHDNADELGHVIQKWIEETRNDGPPR